MRAKEADFTGQVVRDGVTLGYEVYGSGDTTVLLMPTWTIIHSRFWKFQIPYLARHYRVITYDGPGNGRSDRITDPVRYRSDEYAADAIAVLDECGVDHVIAVGLSRGASYASVLARNHPERVSGVVLIGAALAIAPPPPERAGIAEHFSKSYPPNPQGWDKYNLAYWHDNYEDFVRFFMGKVFSEPFSTKAFDDSVGWGLETGPHILEAEAANGEGLAADEVLASIECPVLVIHGTDDQIISPEVGRRAAEITGGALISLEGSGHMPLAKDPVRVNYALREFIESVAP